MDRASERTASTPSRPAAGPFDHINRRFDARVNATVATLHPGDYYVAADGELVGTVLGSCISACIRDSRLRVGGMNHFMLPMTQFTSSDSWSCSAWVETRFGNVAMERLINEIMKRGGHRSDLEVKLVGGGKVLDTLADVGARNIQFVREYVRAEGFRVVGEDLGDVYPRKVLYDPASGAARVKRLPRSTHVVAEETRYLSDIDHAPPGGEIELFHTQAGARGTGG
ncbi:MAG: chemoreceptor glutamine deamidase CheD [Steroidobacteraceae bacterium]